MELRRPAQPSFLDDLDEGRQPTQADEPPAALQDQDAALGAERQVVLDEAEAAPVGAPGHGRVHPAWPGRRCSAQDR